MPYYSKPRYNYTMPRHTLAPKPENDPAPATELLIGVVQLLSNALMPINITILEISDPDIQKEVIHEETRLLLLRLTLAIILLFFAIGLLIWRFG